MGLDIEKVLVVASNHVPETLATETDAGDSAPLVTVSAMFGDYGWLVSVDHHLAPLDKHPDSIVQVIRDLLHFAKKKGCRYVMFDADGPELKQFPVYDW